jgi:tRNA (cmo5U34)-methyltransferase
MSAHSVEKHLRVDVDEYDAQIRRFVPHYEEMLVTAVSLLGALVPEGATVLDLGGGTGALTQAVLRALPRCRVTLLDIDTQMLEQARLRLANDLDRVTILRASFHDALPPHDAVVASLSLHHIPDLETKTRVYAGIRASLPAGGLFLNLDATVGADRKLAALTFAEWVAWMGAHGIDEAAARKHLDDWSREDFYQPLEAELSALVRAGFSAPECFWKRGPTTIFGARRD